MERRPTNFLKTKRFEKLDFSFKEEGYVWLTQATFSVDLKYQIVSKSVAYVLEIQYADSKDLPIMRSFNTICENGA
jgi:hypothetical protein